MQTSTSSLPKSPIAFVRARPRKITITETYCYKVQVQEFVNFRFDKAEGEVKLEFIYDGEDPNVRWKLRQFIDSLISQVKVLKWIKGKLEYFFDLRVLKWLTKWSGLALLYQRLVEILLGGKRNPKYFDTAAIKDAKAYNAEHETALAGHLVLYDSQQSKHAKGWSPYNTFAVELPINDLQQKLEQNQKCTFNYKYEPPQPTVSPLHLPRIELKDTEINRAERLYPSYDELLRLTIPFEIDATTPTLDENDQVRIETVKQWWQEIQAKITEGKKTKKEKVEQEKLLLVLDQIWYIDSLDELDEIVQLLAIQRGGYILIDANQVKIPDGKDAKEKFSSLKERLLQAAFQQNNKVFVPVLPPYSYSIDGKEVFVVPVPPVPPRWYDNRPKTNTKMENPLWVDSNAAKIPITGVPVNDDTSSITNLAEIIASFANTQGGCFSLNYEGPKRSKPSDIEKLIRQACKRCLPPIHPDTLSLDHYGDGIFIGEVAQSSKEVHSVEKAICKWENQQIHRLRPDKDADEIYKLIRERCRPNYPTIEPLPVIEYAHLKGPAFDAREQNGAHYDPRHQALRWTEKLPFWYDIDERIYQNRIQIELNRPVELYQQGELSGEVRIVWPQKVLSGLGFAYFDALGAEIAEDKEKPTVEKKSIIKVTFEHIILLDIFRRRGFSALRELHFEGVKLEPNRLQDIQGMLADLGLENINTRPNIFSLQDTLVDRALKNGAHITGRRADGLQIEMEISGEATNLHRERKEGERIERMRIKSGSMHIIIYGWVSGDLQQAQDLSKLLNHLQRLLKERFNYVRIQAS